MELTKDQTDFFETFGFLAFRGLFSPSEMETMLRESNEIMSADRDGNEVGPPIRQAVQPFFERRPYLHSLITDSRMLAIADGLLGKNNYFMELTEGNLHVGDTAWHGGFGSAEVLSHIKVSFYLEPLVRETGALCVIPGSHKGDFSERLSRISDRAEDPDAKVWGVHPRDVPSYAIESTPGDVLVFKEDTYHGAWGGHPGRHQHAINYVQLPKTDEQLAHVRGMYEKSKYSFRPVKQNLESDDQVLRRLQQPMVDWGFEVQSV